MAGGSFFLPQPHPVISLGLGGSSITCPPRGQWDLGCSQFKEGLWVLRALPGVGVLSRGGSSFGGPKVLLAVGQSGGLSGGVIALAWGSLPRRVAAWQGGSGSQLCGGVCPCRVPVCRGSLALIRGFPVPRGLSLPRVVPIPRDRARSGGIPARLTLPDVAGAPPLPWSASPLAERQEVSRQCVRPAGRGRFCWAGRRGEVGPMVGGCGAFVQWQRVRGVSADAAALSLRRP